MESIAQFVNERIEKLRPKLQDTSRRNPLINNVLSAKTASFIRIVDEKPQQILECLTSDESSSMNLVPLPPIDIDPPDENTAEFKTAFENAKVTDEDYLKVLEEIDFEYDEKALDKQELADRKLKDKIRELLELPPRPQSDQLIDLVNHAKSHGINPSATLPLPNTLAVDNRYEDDDLQTLLLPKTFQSRMSRILSKARMYQEERGLEVVYVVIGYLRWTLPNAEKNDEFKSPVILIPVSLKKSKTSEGEVYSVIRRGDPVLNPSLTHKLLVEAKVDLKQVSNLVSENQFQIEDVFNEIENLKPKNMGWSIKREASFGVYPFQGIDLYYDLDTSDLDFSGFPIISELLVGRESGNSEGGEYSDADVESDIGERLVPHLVLDADSSQFIALLKIANGENVALEGPPGSGKSQTIVNAIANAIYSGKKVLFVAQKVTALEVVYSRLQALGLDSFVLPMMGGHANNDEFYDAVKDRLDIDLLSGVRELDQYKTQLKIQRDKLARYIDVLIRHVDGTGMTVHQVLGLAIENHKNLSELPISLRAIEIEPMKYSTSFATRDVHAVAERVAKWAVSLGDTALDEASIWEGAPIDINTDLISDALVSSRESILKIERSSSSLSQEERQLLSSYFDNDLESITFEIKESINDELLKKLHQLVSSLGQQRVEEELERVLLSYDRLNEARAKLKLSFNELESLFENKEIVIELRDFMLSSSSVALFSGYVQKTINENREKLQSLNELNAQEEKMRAELGGMPSFESLKAFEKIILDQGFLLWIKDYLQDSGLYLALSEFRKAKTIHRKMDVIFGETQNVSFAELKKLQGVIEKSGIFSFLSSQLKVAKKRVSELFVSVDEKSPKSQILNSIEEGLDLVKDWKKLGISEVFEELDKKNVELFSKATTMLGEIEQIQSTHELSESLAIKVATYADLKNILEKMGKVELKVNQRAWGSVREELLLLESSFNDGLAKSGQLIEAERLLMSLGATSFDEIQIIAESLGQSFLNEELKARKAVNEDLNYLADSEESAAKLFGVFKDYKEMSAISKELAFKEGDNNVLNVVSSNIHELESIVKSLEMIQKAKTKLLGNKPLSINKTIDLLELHRNDQKGLAKLVARRAIFSEAEQLGFSKLLDGIYKFSEVSSFASYAEAAIVASLVDTVEKAYGSELLQFDGKSLESARKQLQELDRKIIEISPSEVSRSAITKSNPPEGISYGKKSDFTDLSLLKHELQKKRRTPPRKLLKRAQGALIELFPCWMMVPGSVAQHLPRQTLFDLVIIDEASQMTPENSISALVRGKNTLIAGDTNQLPPTNFFKGLSSDDEDEDEDLATPEESILELANVQFHPKHRLLWHYRSKHEDLIAFSNHYVYDQELVIFPSPVPATKTLGISLIEVNGTFQKGINPAEAQVMLDAIVQFMKDTPERSLGVAVMNQSQMEQIESLVMREAETNKVVSDYLDFWVSAREGLEKFFVKNLENVQGDERDVIFVGTVYGRDPLGKFYQRFGPINGPAGKRRLNVLFSRAKEQIVTFSSIPMADFKPSPTNEGATLLRRWLEFSATKRLGETSRHEDRAGYPDSPFEEHVIEAIRSIGYIAVPQVGVSTYFIDIGVQHSTYPLGYICGVECDGASYHSSKSARDRDRLREEVLNRLGWDLYRIWSTDWFRDPLGCRAALKEYLDKRLALVISEMPEIPDDFDQELFDDELDVEGSSIVENVLDKPSIEIGKKISIRYLNGPRAGVTAKLWFQRKTNDPTYSLEGFITVGPDSPLGASLQGAYLDEICTYKLSDADVQVQVLEIED